MPLRLRLRYDLLLRLDFRIMPYVRFCLLSAIFRRYLLSGMELRERKSPPKTGQIGGKLTPKNDRLPPKIFRRTRRFPP
jgi:hypothetical protein